MGVQKRRKFNSDFKRSAVTLSQGLGRTVSDVAEELGIGRDQLYKRRKMYERQGTLAFPGNDREALSDDCQKIRFLEKQLKEAEMERDILKKAALIFSRA